MPWVWALQGLQGELEVLLRADAEKEEALMSRLADAEALQARLEEQERLLEQLRSSQSEGQASVQALQADTAALQGVLAEKEGQIEHWRAEAASVQEAHQQGSSSAQELTDRVRKHAERSTDEYGAMMHSACPLNGGVKFMAECSGRYAHALQLLGCTSQGVGSASLKGGAAMYDANDHLQL